MNVFLIATTPDQFMETAIFVAVLLGVLIILRLLLRIATRIVATGCAVILVLGLLWFVGRYLGWI